PNDAAHRAGPRAVRPHAGPEGGRRHIAECALDAAAFLPQVARTDRSLGDKPMSTRLVALAAVLFSACAFAEDVPVIKFDSVPDPLKLPNDIYFGEVTGVAVNSRGHVFVLSRGNSTGPAYGAAAAQLLEFDPSGKFVREIGKNLYAWSFGHSVRV